MKSLAQREVRFINRRILSGFRSL